jgi:hypothetical protein
MRSEKALCTSERTAQYEIDTSSRVDSLAFDSVMRDSERERKTPTLRSEWRRQLMISFKSRKEAICAAGRRTSRILTSSAALQNLRTVSLPSARGKK